MRLLSRPDCIGLSYPRACMYNHMLDRGIYIYHQTKHFAQSYSMEDMTKQFIIVYCFHYLSIWVKMIWVKSRDNDFYYASILELLLDELAFIVLISLLNASQYYQWQFLWFIIYYKMANIEHFFLDQTELRRGEN